MCNDELSSVGGGGGERGFQVKVSLTKKKKTLTRLFIFFYFLVLILFYRSQMVNFKDIYHFSRFQRGSNIFQGGGGGPIAYSLLKPI